MLEIDSILGVLKIMIIRDAIFHLIEVWDFH